MLYRAIEPSDFFTIKDAKHEIADIMNNNGAQLKLVSVKKESGFDSHMFNTNVCIYLISGEIKLTFMKDSFCGCNICSCIDEGKDFDNKDYKIKKGQLFLFEKDVRHSLRAIKDSVFLLIKI